MYIFSELSRDIVLRNSEKKTEICNRKTEEKNFANSQRN